MGRDVGMGGLLWACASVSEIKNGGTKWNSEGGERSGNGVAHAACLLLFVQEQRAEDTPCCP